MLGHVRGRIATPQFIDAMSSNETLEVSLYYSGDKTDVATVDHVDNLACVRSMRSGNRSYTLTLTIV